MIIALEGLKFHSSIGYHSEEQLLGNEMEVSVRLTIENNSSNDDIHSTVDYFKVYDAIKEVMQQKMNLLETACDQIITKISSQFIEVKKIEVEVAKLHPPIQGKIDRVLVRDEWVRPS